MAKYEDIWKLLDRYQFEIDSHLSVYVTCIICKKLLNDAYVGPCGCKYCRKCLEDYIGNGGRHCPGNMNECKMSFLDLNTNVIKIHGINRSISNLYVRCPTKSCSFHAPILQMWDHLKQCEMKSESCPYIEIGCIQTMTENDKIQDHLFTEIYQHNKLLIDWMKKTNDEMMRQQENLEIQMNNLEQLFDLKLSIVSINNDEDRQVKEALLGHLEKEIRAMDDNYGELPTPTKGPSENCEEAKDIPRKRSEISYFIRNRMIKQEKEIVHMRENRKRQEKDLFQVKDILKDQEKEISQLRYDRKEQEKKIGKLREDLKKQEKNILQLKAEKEKQQKEISQLGNESIRLEKEINQLKIYLDRQERCIVQLTEKQERKTSIFKNEKDKKDKENKTENQEKELTQVEKCQKNELELANLTSRVDILKGNKDKRGSWPDTEINLEKETCETDLVDSNFPEVIQPSRDEVKTIATHRWEILEIPHKRKNKTFLSSGCFNTCDDEYQITLWLYSGGCSGHPCTHICIHFILSPSAGKNELKWSFTGRVMISMENSNEPSARESISKNCKLDQTQKSELFHFASLDLEQSRVFENRSIVIECVVEIEQ